MSLEEAVQGLTTAVAALTATLSGLQPESSTRAAAAAAAAESSSAATPEPAGKGRGRPTNAEKAAAVAAKNAPPAAQQATPEPARSQAVEFTYAQVQARLMELDKEKGRQAVIDLLSRFGVTKLPEINPTQFGAFMADINACFDAVDQSANSAANAGGLF